MGGAVAAASVFKAVSTAATVLSAVSSLTQKGPKAPKMSTQGPVSVMPTEDSAMVQEAKRRTLVAQAARGGRMSTVLTDSDNESFGGN